MSLNLDLFRQVGAVDLRPAVDPTNKRIHIYFKHGGIISHFVPYSGTTKSDIETFLKDVWSQFGTVVDTYYHCEFSFGFVTFQSHDQAAAAIEGINDPNRIQAAIRSVASGRKELAEMMFVEERGKYALASWASPRTS